MYTNQIRRLFTHSRPRFWLYLLGPVLVAGAVVGPNAFTTYTFWAFFLFTTLPANLYLYGVNDLADRDTDKYNKKKEEKEAKAKKKDTLLRTSVYVSFVVPLLLLLFLSLEASIILLLYVFLATFYSLEPLRFKANPFIDSFSNVLYILPGVALYTELSQTLPSLLAVLGGWAWTAAMHLFSAIPDIEPDKKAGLTTTAVLLGERKSLVLCFTLWTIATGVAFYFAEVLGILSLVYPLLTLLPLFDITVIDKQYWWYPYINGFLGFLLFWLLLLPRLI